MSSRTYSIATIGIWHLGETYSNGLAKIGHRVVGIDNNAKVIENLSKNIPPLPEPDLEELLEENQVAGKLSYTTNFSKVDGCDIVWLTFDTPVNDEDEVDPSPIWDGLIKCIPYLKEGALVAVSSQIPVGTSKKIQALIHEKRPELHFDYVYSPENLRLGEALHCFLEPGRVVVGAETESAFTKMEEVLGPLHAEIVRMAPASAEMAKHALNAFLATSLSFINDIADACEKSGADVLDVVRALRSDARVGQKAFLGPGLGFSGGTLGRDLKALMRFSKEEGFGVPVIEAAYLKNRSREEAIVEKLKGVLGGMDGKTIALFGLTYKPGTRTLRRSKSLIIAAELARRGARLRLQDPVVLEEELPRISNAVFSRDPYESGRGSEAIMLLTPWPEFKALDLVQLSQGMIGKKAFLDPWNLLYDKQNEFEKLGFIYEGTGR